MDNKLINTRYLTDTVSMQITADEEIVISDEKPDIKEIIYDNTKAIITYMNVMDSRVSFKGILKERVIVMTEQTKNLSNNI